MLDEWLPRFFDPDRDAEGREGIPVAEMMAAFRTRDVAAFESCCRDLGWFGDPYMVLGDTARALEAAHQRFLDNRVPPRTLHMKLWEPEWDGRRADPRFREMARRVNLEGAELKRAAPDG